MVCNSMEGPLSSLHGCVRARNVPNNYWQLASAEYTQTCNLMPTGNVTLVTVT